MNSIEHTSARQALAADHPSLDADPGIEAGTAITLEYLPIGPFMLLVAFAIQAFIPAFAVIALVAVAAAVLALPFLLIGHLAGRR
jgi:hypothetical protein